MLFCDVCEKTKSKGKRKKKHQKYICVERMNGKKKKKTIKTITTRPFSIHTTIDRSIELEMPPI